MDGSESFEPLDHLSRCWSIVSYWLSNNRPRIRKRFRGIGKRFYSCKIISLTQFWIEKTRKRYPQFHLKCSLYNNCVFVVLSYCLCLEYSRCKKEILEMFEGVVSWRSVKEYLSKHGYIAKRVPLLNCKNTHVESVLRIPRKSRGVYLLTNENHMFAVCNITSHIPFIVDSTLSNISEGILQTKTMTRSRNTSKDCTYEFELNLENIEKIYKQCGRIKRIYKVNKIF